MLVPVAVLVFGLSSVTRSSNVTKREANGFGAAAAASSGYGAPAQGYGSPNLGGSSANSYGPKCRDQTKFILTWTKTIIPVTLYDTRTQHLPTTLYRYATETEYYDVTSVKLQTTAKPIRAGYKMETKISYRTRTIVVPQVERVTSTLIFTEDEHVTVTETDRLTKTQLQQYPVEVTRTSVVQVPQVQTSVVIEQRVQTQKRRTTQQYNVVETRTVNVPEVQYITTTRTDVRYNTVSRTEVQQNYVTVTKCAQQTHQQY